jgi:hypothetical protein
MMGTQVGSGLPKQLKMGCDELVELEVCIISVFLITEYKQQKRVTL